MDIVKNSAVVFILDDNEAFRSSTAWLLESMDYTVSVHAEQSAAVEELASVPESQACCLLLDVRMPGLSGLDVHDLLLEKNLHVPVIYMTGHGDVPLAVTAMGKGAVTFLEKPLNEEALIIAVDQALALSHRRLPFMRMEREEIAAAHARRASLTPREEEVLALLFEDMPCRDMADKLDISVRTVEVHRARVLNKFEVRTVAQLVRLLLISEAV